jgi:hypothetical protein
VGRTWLPSASAWQLRASWRLLCPTARVGELRAFWRLLCPTARPWQLRASWRWPTAHPWQLRGSRLSHRSLLATGSLLDASLLPPESTWVARLQVASLRARPAAANPATSRSRGPSHRSRTRTLRPGRQEECRRWSRKLKEIVILNHIS